MKKKKYSRWDYIQFPLHLLPYILEDQKGTIKDIFLFGVYYHSITLKDFKGNQLEAVNHVIHKLKLPFDVDAENVLKISHSIKQEKGFVDFYPMVKIKKLIDFLREDKKPRKVMDLIAYIGIHSILGKKHRGRVFLKTLLARMCGYVSRYDVPIELNNIQEIICHHHCTYDKVNRMFNRLEKEYYVTKSTKKGSHGYYVTIGDKAD